MSKSQGDPRVGDDGLTDRQREIYTFIYDTVRDEGYQPSLDETAHHFGMAYRSSMLNHFRALIRKKWLLPRGTGLSRSYVLLRHPDGSPFNGFFSS